MPLPLAVAVVALTLLTQAMSMHTSDQVVVVRGTTRGASAALSRVMIRTSFS
jgi:hypothetical protein